jgi:flagellar protein FliO/FliZ
VALETSLKFALAFVLVLGLIALGAWTLRRFGLGMVSGATRGRRLAVIETLALDARHRLVLVRRDDREHLILFGAGETVVETGIAAPITVPSAESRS